jgi:hypothetical protein
MARFGLGRRNVSDRPEQAAVVEPVDPLECGEFHRVEAAPRPAPMDHLGLEEAYHRLGERIVVAVADAADGGLDGGLRESLGVADGQVLAPPDALLFVKRRTGPG